VIIMFELTGDYTMVLPLMAAIVLAQPVRVR
jgi:H+/Cl- antiporter ClcA